jgi:membrane protease subunit HflK
MSLHRRMKTPAGRFDWIYFPARMAGTAREATDMPWSNQNGGGPWGGGGGGGGGKGPWGGGSGQLFLLALLVIAGLWIWTGVYRVQEGELGMELVFGEWDGITTQPGLRINFPAPIGQTYVLNVQKSNRMDIGFNSGDDSGRGRTSSQTNLRESLMLTGDQNIADIEVRIAWRIGDPSKFVFNIRNPEGTVKVAAESAMREVVGQTLFIDAVGEGRGGVETRTLELLQTILDGYDVGIIIEDVQIQKSRPPAQVVDAFDDLQRAEQDKERMENEADAYANSVVPEARGNAARMIQEAEAYKERLVKESEGEAQRFLSVYEAYRTAPEVTRRRMYLEAMGEVFSTANKVIIDSGAGGSGVVPYLPLPELQKRAAPAAGQN